ncbi:hypothetical protein FHG87_015260 [Trinorchestia longiramus]|nr:hypothetical protein FHG87_015260 [Trinorchestia longiramus]
MQFICSCTSRAAVHHLQHAGGIYIPHKNSNSYKSCSSELRDTQQLLLLCLTHACFCSAVPRLQEVMMKTSLICLLLLVAVACAEISFSDVLEESVRASASSFDKIDFGTAGKRQSCSGRCRVTFPFSEGDCDKYGSVKTSCSSRYYAVGPQSGCYCCL